MKYVAVAWTYIRPQAFDYIFPLFAKFPDLLLWAKKGTLADWNRNFGI